ncbi:MAG: hypothetical protein PCFJNLEI_01461 [Verrucomicrobiae bacterium]|nr:hypothetical protein [Verrucomicrobiae bacterium]
MFTVLMNEPQLICSPHGELSMCEKVAAPQEGVNDYFVFSETVYVPY